MPKMIEATSAIATVQTIERGSALPSFPKDDFFAVDLNPAEGGPGFTVGYVADLSGKCFYDWIALTGANPPCLLNELLEAKLGLSIRLLGAVRPRRTDRP